MSISLAETGRRWEEFLAANRAAREVWGSRARRWLVTSRVERLAALAAERFQGVLAGRLVVCSGMDAAGGAWSLAAGWQGAAFLGIDADAGLLKGHVRTGFCDYLVTNLEEALRILRSAVHARKPVSAGLAADPDEALAALAGLGVAPDLLIAPLSCHAAALASFRRLGSMILSR